MTKIIIQEKRWHSVLVCKPEDGWIGRCLAIAYDERSAGYSQSNYQWYNGEWWPRTGSPTPRNGWVITHWLDDPEVYPPLPEGWPDIGIEEVHAWLKPYLEDRNDEVA